MAKAKTKKEFFNEIKEVLQEVGREDLVSVMEHEIELVEKKNSKRGESATQKANETLKGVILEELARVGKPVTVTELQNASEKLSVTNFSNQKMSALLNQLANENVVVKVIDKKKSYFSLGE